MKVFVVGGDGFCGWPTALHLSESGCDVVIIDNLSRRKIDVELATNSLTPISPIARRLEAWKEFGGREIRFEYMDVATEYDRMSGLIAKEQPEAIIHFGEQRAAPYSMKTSATKRYTVNNNLNATHNILCAIVESKQNIHLVHLGTMGVYGYGSAGMKIPEGYLEVTLRGRSVDDSSKINEVTQEILYPAHPGSV